MTVMLTRRTVLMGAALLLPPRLPRRDDKRAIESRLKAARKHIAQIEKRVGGRLGVAALDTASEVRLDHRTHERFPLCGTFKFFAVAAVLARVDQGEDSLDRHVPFESSDLLDYAPVTKERVAEGGMTLRDLCAAAIEYSDDTAGNLLLGAIGGPEGMTRYARSLGDKTTRLDGVDPTLNTEALEDPRDTTTPDAMLRDMRAILTGMALSQKSRAQIEEWLVGCKTGASRMHAGLPPDWRIGHKTGSGGHGATNDIAILWPPDERPPILVAAYCADSRAPGATRNAALADVARIVSVTF